MTPELCRLWRFTALLTIAGPMWQDCPGRFMEDFFQMDETYSSRAYVIFGI